MRKKMNDKDKKTSFGITIHPELYKIIEEYTKTNNISKSKLIEDIMKKHLKNNNNNKNE